MKKIILSIFVFVLMFSTLANTPNTAHVSAQPRRDLEIAWYPDFSTCYSGLKTDEVDIACDFLSYEQFKDAQADPNIQLASYDETGIIEFDINNNYSIMSYPNVRSPTNELKVRRAIAYLVNKSYIVEEILPKFFGEVIDVPISNAQSGWWNASVTGSNYPYPYNPDAAASLLASLGFNDTDGNGYLNYPSDWPGIQNLPSTDTTSMPLKIVIRQDHADREKAGDYLIYQLEGNTLTPRDSPLAMANWPPGFVGGDFDTYVLPPIRIQWDVHRDRNYHIYTGAWSLSISPPTYMYSLFHSMSWYPYGPNYVTDMEYHDLDEELEKAYYAQDISTAMFHCRNAQGLLVDKYCVSIWLWNYNHFNAYRKELVGVVSQQSWGVDNPYTYLTSYRADDPGAATRVGIPMVPDRLNVLYSPWLYEGQMLDKVYTYLMSKMPYSLEVDQPWAAQDWELGTWYDPRDGIDKTMVTFWLRKDVGCTEPQTGNLVDYFTADDFGFTVWYTYAFSDAWVWDSVMGVHHVKIVNDYQVEVYFDAYNMWLLYAIGGGMPLLGPRDVLVDKLCERTSATFKGADLVEVAPGYYEYQFSTDQVVELINASVHGNLIHENEDFYIRAGYDVNAHNVFVNLTSFAPTDVITINYYRAIPNGADGFYLGGNLGYDWTDTMYSYGLYYPVSINPVSGDGAFLKRNQYFFLETPALGEIDWRWYWEGTAKPRSGNYAISILDVVESAIAYCSRGDGEYNPRYLPAADIDPNDLCHIGIFDLVTIASKYGKRFGTPPNQ